MTNYRTFWVVSGIYFISLTLITASGMEVLKFLDRTVEDFGGDININRIPLYHFPDVWQNLIWVAGFFKFVLGVMVIISITNEYTYRTVRQNIIDGLSRWEFIKSKILMNVVLAAASMVLMFFIAFVTGLIYSPELNFSEVINDIEFFPAYFLQVFGYLSFAMLLAMLINRSGLTIIVLMLARAFELFLIHKAVDVDAITPFFPLESFESLITVPFMRYVFQEILDYPQIQTILTAIFWIVVINYLAYLKLKKADI